MEERRRQKTPQARTLAATVALPEWARGHFSLAMLAVLGAIRDEADEQGRCTASVAQIGARAGVSRRTTQIAIKTAHSIGAIAIEDTAAGNRVIINRCIRTHRGGGRSI